MTKPTTGQIIRAVRTLQTRKTRTYLAQAFGARLSTQHRLRAGVRRAKTKTLRLMAEYLGVGEPVPYKFGCPEVVGWVYKDGNTFRLEMQKDRTLP